MASPAATCRQPAATAAMVCIFAIRYSSPDTAERCIIYAAFRCPFSSMKTEDFLSATAILFHRPLFFEADALHAGR